MRLMFAILISLFSASAIADGLSAFLSMPAAAFIAPLQFQFREGGRHWSSQELEKDNLNSSFRTWLMCYRSPGNPECNNCDTHQDQNVLEIENLARDKCLPARNDLPIAYAENLDEDLKRQRDNDICGCYRERGAGPIGDLAFSLGSDIESRDAARSERRDLQERQQRLQHGILANQTRQRLITERFQTSFSAASYSDNASEAVSLGALYSQMAEHEHENVHEQIQINSSSRTVAAGAAGIASGMHALISSAEAEAEARKVTTNDFTSENILSRPGYCVPYRHFLASKQYPTDESFYEDLRRQDDFDWRDWNYPILLKQFQNVLGDRSIKAALLSEPTGKVSRMYQRIKFLYDNPVIKNIFQSGKDNKEVIRSLIGIIRKMPRPVCNSNGCTQDEASNSRLRDYRREMAAFLRREDVISASHAGAESSHGTQIQIAVASAEASLFSDVLNPASEVVDASRWRAFCDEKAVQASALRSRDVSFVIDLESAIGRRNFEDPTLDKDYALMNEEVCTKARTGSNGQKTFQQFLTDLCGTRTSGECSVESRPNLVGRFLREFPNSTSPRANSYSNLATFLGGSGQVASVSSDNIETYNEISGDPVLARNSLNSNSSSFVSQRSAPVQNIISPSQSDAPTSNAGFTQPQQMIIPQVQAATPVATARANSAISEGETQAQVIRNEISSLRSVLRREPSDGGPRDSQAMQTLTQRLASLEQRLADKEDEIETLRSRKASQDDSEASPSRVASQTPLQNSSRGSSPSAAQAIIPQGGASGGSASVIPASGSPSFSGISSGATSRVSSGSSGNSALLSKYGVREVSEQGGITVASASDSIDYQQLRSETENSILPLSVTNEEFNLISQNNQSALSRYLDQVRALPGEVVRINLSSGDRTMEVYVLKSGDQISFVPAPSVAAQRAPASVSPDRTHMLETLQKELVQ